jgi:hypothetical protein
MLLAMTLFFAGDPAAGESQIFRQIFVAVLFLASTISGVIGIKPLLDYLITVFDIPRKRSILVKFAGGPLFFAVSIAYLRQIHALMATWVLMAVPLLIYTGLAFVVLAIRPHREIH